MNSSSRLIYVMGIDGSGKSTLTEHLSKCFSEQGLSVDVLWLRYNHVFSKPLLGFCRLIGLTQYENAGGIKVGYHHFYRSKIISNLFIVLQYLDALRVKWFVLRPLMKKENHVIILDRYVYDILVDLAVDTHKWGLADTWLGKRFIDLLPAGAEVLLVRRSWDAVIEARPEGEVDRFFSARFEQFERLAQAGAVEVVDNIGTLEALLQSSEQKLGLAFYEK